MGLFRGVELADLTLSGPRLDLRRWGPDDAERVWTALQDPTMGEFLPVPRPYTPRHAQHDVSPAAHPGRDAGTGLGSALVERSSGRVVGMAAVSLGAEPGVSYWTAPDARGHGYAAEAVRVLADWAFGLGVPRIELLCDVRNLASVHTALAAGFGFEGVGREACLDSAGPDGRRADLARFARLADDPGERIAPAFPPLRGEVLSDGTVALRTMQPRDGAAFQQTEDAETLRWSFYGTAQSPKDVTRTATRAGLQWLVGQEARFAMVDVATGAFAGELQLRAGPPQTGSLGYVVHPAFRGRGYTTRALRLVTPWAFEVVGLARLQLGAKTGNVASQRAALSAGFAPEGVHAGRLRNADGTFADELGLALVNPRYR